MDDPHSLLTSLRDHLDAYFSNCSIQNDVANYPVPSYLRGPQNDPLFGSQQHIFDNVYNEQRELIMQEQQAEIEQLDNGMRELNLEENNALMPFIREPSHGIRNHEETEETPQEELSGFGKETTAPQRPESPYSTCDPEPSVTWTPGYVPEYNACCGAG